MRGDEYGCEIIWYVSPIIDFSVFNSDSCADILDGNDWSKDTHITPYSLQAILSKTNLSNILFTNFPFFIEKGYYPYRSNIPKFILYRPSHGLCNSIW